MFVVWLVLTTGSVAVAADCNDPAAMAAARAEVDASCDCAAALTHSQYVRCGATVLRARYAAGTLSRDCVRPALRCARRSTCGRPGSVTCCRPHRGEQRCGITRTGARCLGAGGCVGAFTSCCDACDAGGCAVPTTTSSSTSTTTTTATPVCGNGIVEAGEQCDTPLGFCLSCRYLFTRCCELPTECSSYVSSGTACLFGGGRLTDGACDAENHCVDVSSSPVTVCCELVTGCLDATVASSAEYNFFMYHCLGAGGSSNGLLPSGTCGVAGDCVPAP